MKESRNARTGAKAGGVPGLHAGTPVWAAAVDRRADRARIGAAGLREHGGPRRAQIESVRAEVADPAWADRAVSDVNGVKRLCRSPRSTSL